jgi:hypothetical protein
MRRPNRSSIKDLRRTIDCLPVHTRVAMLEGIRGNEIIVGAYSDRHGGVCPMLAAHRCGGRTNFISFARAWDRFAGSKRARRATERELAVLSANLEASLIAAEGLDLDAAVRDHQALARGRREREAATTGDDFLYSGSPVSLPSGPMNCISGTMQPGEVLKR